MATETRPTNVGLKAIEIYVPNKYISQADLEVHDKVSTGKYEIGLGQHQMGFCDDREDIYSFCLTAVSQLLKKYDIPPESIGRLEVGTETLIDKSKSVKSVLMQLFSPSGNTDIEGVDTINACYGGTNALFNAINWVESSAWDGRDAIVVAGDIAIYEKGPARPTGGAGAVAMLIGPNAPLVLEPGMRGTFMQHAYDFYKPNMSSEYPVVDGQYSIECFSRALDECHKAYCNRLAKFEKLSNGSTSNGLGSHHTKGSQTLLSDRFDYMCFHTPNCKLAQKSYGRLLYNDYLLNPDEERFDIVPETVRDTTVEDSYRDKSIEKTFMALTNERYKTSSAPSAHLAKNTGNMYTASLYGALASLICENSQKDLDGKRIAMFSYGSGLASTLFSIKVNGNLDEMKKALDVRARLKARHYKTPEDYEQALYLREAAYSKANFEPSGGIHELVEGTYFLTKVDAKFRRSYEIKQ